MLRLETSTTSVNAAWNYLLDNGVRFDSPVKEITSRALQRADLSRPLVKKDKKPFSCFQNMKKSDINKVFMMYKNACPAKIAALKAKFFPKA